MTKPGTTKPFRENSRRYKCCSGRIKASVGVMIFSLLEIIPHGVMGAAWYLVYIFPYRVEPLFIAIFGVGAALIYSIFPLMAFMGMRKMKAGFVIVFAVLEGIEVVFYVIALLLSYASNVETSKNFRENVAPLWIMLPAAVVYCFLKAWAIMCVVGAARYIIEKIKRGGYASEKEMGVASTRF